MQTYNITPISSKVLDGGEFIFLQYVAINPDGLPRGCYKLRIINLTDKDVVISYDGTTSNDYIAAGGELKVEGPGNRYGVFPAHTIVYAQAASVGGVSNGVILTGYALTV